MTNTVILLPTDNRPITYIFPQEICKLAGLDILVPPRYLMGSLFSPTDLSSLNDWIEHAAANVECGTLLLCIDTLLYGGLIPSRRSDDKLKLVLERAHNIASLKKRSGNKLKIYAQSSIMRISDNYDNTEEKLYWSNHGREIFNWSQLLHKKELGLLKSDIELATAEASIPEEVRQDYLDTRKRNFTVNKKIIDYVISGDLDFLIFSQDDSGKYGLNVSEKDQLLALAKSKGAQNVLAYPGADEMLMTLIARYLNDDRALFPKIALHFTATEGSNLSSNFEGQTIAESMQNQANGQGLQIEKVDITSEAVDFHVIVHTGSDKQGDHIWLPGLDDLRLVETKNSSRNATRLIEQAKAPIVICDIAYSNGADPLLIDLLMASPQLFDKVWAYGGWNTTGNAVGSALALGSACLYANTGGRKLEDELRKKMLFARLMDDWAYQTQVRQQIRACKSDIEEQVLMLNQLMNGFASKIARSLDFAPGPVQYTFPWRRSFEVEVNLDHPSPIALS